MSPAGQRDASIADFALALSLLVRRIRTSAPGDLHELSWTQKAVMARLEKDGPMTSAELARAEGVKPQSMGTAIAALEELGLVERRRHRTDGRQLNIQLTTRGVALRSQLREAKHLWLSEAIGKLDKSDQAALFAAGKIIKRLVEL